jgi:glutathione S-transferase
MSSKSATGYHLQCSGQAAATAHAHENQHATITAYFACFCPFVQRAWIALEFLGQGVSSEEAKAMGIDYWYVEVDPYKKPKELLEVSPKGLVP